MTRFQVREQPRWSPAFTLVELLVVVGIMVVLMALIGPAVNSLGRASALDAAGNKVANLAALARQSAISKNALTALVLLGAQGTTDDFRTFTVVSYEAGRGWSQIAPWEALPAGIVVDSNPTDCTFLTNSPPTFPFLAGPPVQANPPLVFRGTQVTANAYAARIFLSSGGLQNPEKPAQLRLVEGVSQGGAVVYTRPGAAGKPSNYYDITIIGTTGIVNVSRP